jgi:hypothetical protein
MAGYAAHTGNSIPRFVEDQLSLALVRTFDTRTGFHALRESYGCRGQLMVDPSRWLRPGFQSNSC